MGLRSAIARRIGGKALTEVIESSVEKAVAEAIAGLEFDPDDYLYRREGGRAPERDLLHTTHERAIEAVVELYAKNPLAHRIIDLTPDFIVGEGIGRTYRNPNVEDVVEDFWTDDDNDLDERAHPFAKELGLYGELPLELHAGDVSGFVKLGYIDPGQIKKIVTAEGNPLVLEAMFIRQRGGGYKGKELSIVRRRNGRLEGQVFFTKINSLSNSTRGWSDLLHLADWLDNYDEFLWNVLERSRLIRNFIWDVLLKGYTPQQIQEWSRKHGEPPEAGTVRAHNENEGWSAVAPQLQSFEMAKEGEVILEHLAGGAGVQKTWLASAEDVNRATAREMGTPTERRLITRQSFFLRRLRRLLRFVLEQAEEAGRLKDVDEKGTVPVYDENGKKTEKRAKPHELIQFQAPELSPRDAASVATALLNVAQALAIAQSEGWSGGMTNRQVLAKLLTRIGFNTDVATMADEALRVEEPKKPALVPVKTKEA